MRRISADKVLLVMIRLDSVDRWRGRRGGGRNFMETCTLPTHGTSSLTCIRLAVSDGSGAHGWSGEVEVRIASTSEQGRNAADGLQ